MTYFRDKTALVTGAGSGIGKVLAAALAVRGARVIPTDVPTLDVRDAGAFARFVEKMERIDFLFNNAGVGVAGETEELTAEHWKYVLDVNLGGTINGILAAYPRMIAQRSGHIVNVASLAGLSVAPLLTAYAASKHAVVGLSRSLRLEAADHNVRVSVICPAAIETPLLDRKNPEHLPPISWGPNIRRYLTALSGPPYDVRKFVNEALDRVAKNQAVIVIPRFARIAWRFGNWFPSLADDFVLKALRAERKTRD